MLTDAIVHPEALVKKSILLLCLAIVVALWVVFYPFWPGQYDGLAVALSMSMQVAGWVGLFLLTPIGLLWLAHELRRGAALSRGATATDRSRVFAIAACIASVAVAGSAAAFAVEESGFALAIILLALWGATVARCLRSARAGNGGSRGLRLAPLYLIVLPALIVVARVSFVEQAAESSRIRVIAACGSYIADIEAYREAHGRYPVSVASLNPDYPTRTVGVDRFRYEPAGDAYNVWFEHVSSRFDVNEIVVYNPRDEQQATSHDADILQFSLERLNQTRGYFAVYEAGVSHWKVFLFD
ncbi:MAG: hypothetical protein KJ057_17820 [Phycisphaerae bacterium]|nr:MAG: hypothetical protein EDS66_17470 [Planctomycetota bacterium]KAB2941013.1 MAG: hypothetical protein F9K17_13440 [Phycisphaerae bacterium]MBE7455115.1 hypothetical protein [Planctomycetia bacterium]MCK6466482.1 hypothetical protein [Phycisphaerae bacterium]MCL4720320.1 hypothetical protein [Phycisphaerae bacterium]